MLKENKFVYESNYSPPKSSFTFGISVYYLELSITDIFFYISY